MTLKNRVLLPSVKDFSSYSLINISDDVIANRCIPLFNLDIPISQITYFPP